MQKYNRQKKTFSKKYLSILGPGIITAALVFGPSKMTITSKMGADYGFTLLWVIIIAIFFMMVFTDMGARIGIAQKDSLLKLIKKKFGKAISSIIGLGIFLVATCFQSGNATGVSISISEASESNPKIWIIVFTIFGITLLFFKSFYVILEKLMLTLIIIMLLTFLYTALMIKPIWSDLAKGFIPSIPLGSSGLIIAFIASCFSIVGAFYQSYLVQANKKLSNNTEVLSKQILGSRVGILILGIMSAAILICTANTLFPQGIHLNSAAEMGRALEPLLGSYASHLFYIGLFGASFSSLIGNAVLGGSLLGDTFGYGSDLNNPIVKLFIALVMIFGSMIALIFNGPPLELIVFAQSITIFLVPLIGIIMFLVANDNEIMGDQVNKPLTKLWATLGLLILVTLAFINLYNLTIK